MWAIRTSSAHKFQSTHPRGVRRWPAVIFTSWKVFQSTHPRGVRLSVYIAAVDQRIFQSTHPRGVRPTCCSLSSAMLHISIHAPARGATMPRPSLPPHYLISIHAPARGATVTIGPGALAELISIHAPARGATISAACCQNRKRNFNPRTREGCDLMKCSLMRGNKKFQSTHPRGVRPNTQIRRRLLRPFQSTHPRGVRQMRAEYALVVDEISIHAPARGAT